MRLNGKTPTTSVIRLVSEKIEVEILRAHGVSLISIDFLVQE